MLLQLTGSLNSKQMMPVADSLWILKGVCHKMNFVKAYDNKKKLSVQTLIVFTIFCFLVDEKSYSNYKLAHWKLSFQ
jgi:hypothetical protein